MKTFVYASVVAGVKNYSRVTFELKKFIGRKRGVVSTCQGGPTLDLVNTLGVPANHSVLVMRAKCVSGGRSTFNEWNMKIGQEQRRNEEQ